MIGGLQKARPAGTPLQRVVTTYFFPSIETSQKPCHRIKSEFKFFHAQISVEDVGWVPNDDDHYINNHELIWVIRKKY
jgi:hypothetical protein